MYKPISNGKLIKNYFFLSRIWTLKYTFFHRKVLSFSTSSSSFEGMFLSCKEYTVRNIRSVRDKGYNAYKGFNAYKGNMGYNTYKGYNA